MNTGFQLDRLYIDLGPHSIPGPRSLVYLDWANAVEEYMMFAGTGYAEVRDFTEALKKPIVRFQNKHRILFVAAGLVSLTFRYRYRNHHPNLEANCCPEHLMLCTTVPKDDKKEAFEDDWRLFRPLRYPDVEDESTIVVPRTF